MTDWIGVGTLVLGVTWAAAAGEIELTNGSRLQGELASDVLIVSTGSDLVEVLPEQIGQLVPGEIRLKNGRVLRGAIVGGRVKMRTALGEIAVTADELRRFRADDFVPGDPVTAAMASTTTPAAATAPAITATRPVGRPPEPLRAAKLPAVQPPAAPVAAESPPEAALAAKLPAAQPPAAAPSSPPTMSAAVPDGTAAVPNGAVRHEPAAERIRGALLEVLAPGPLYRDAVESTNTVGEVRSGEQVKFVDHIDRRLRIFDTVILDGGYWVKVRVGDGTEGWLPAATLRKAR